MIHVECFRLALLLTVLSFGPFHVAGHWSAAERLGMPPHPLRARPADTYMTPHGHEVKRPKFADCHTDAIHVCEPHRHVTPDTWTTNIPMSKVYRCLKNKPHLLPQRCRDWAALQTGCVDDLELHCPNMNMIETYRCAEEKHRLLSDSCRASEWYRHQFQHDYARVSRPRHHAHDYEDPVDVEEDHLTHDHGWNIQTDDAFSDL